jgi:hypothetical protein
MKLKINNLNNTGTIPCNVKVSSVKVPVLSKQIKLTFPDKLILDGAVE